MYIESLHLPTLIKSLKKLDCKKGETLFMMVAEKEEDNINSMIKALNNEGYTFFGGVFIGLLSDTNVYKEGVIVQKFKTCHKPIVINNLSNNNFKLPVSEYVLNKQKDSTAIVLVDGLSSNISKFLSKLFNNFGDTVNYIGGGCGSISFKQKPCLFSNDGFVEDAAIVTIVNTQSILGAKHGWNKIGSHFIATKTEKNIVKEINWQNAFSVYKNVVEKDSEKEINKENFFEIAKSYPFGIGRKNEEYIVRDPIKVTDKGELICVGEMPENTEIVILNGNVKSLICAAKETVKEWNSEDLNINYVLVFDCISRYIFLEDNFKDEISVVTEKIAKINPELLLEGVLSLGEISSHKGYLNFFNKTIVVGLLS